MTIPFRLSNGTENYLLFSSGIQTNFDVVPKGNVARICCFNTQLTETLSFCCGFVSSTSLEDIQPFALVCRNIAGKNELHFVKGNKQACGVVADVIYNVNSGWLTKTSKVYARLLPEYILGLDEGIGNVVFTKYSCDEERMVEEVDVATFKPVKYNDYYTLVGEDNIPEDLLADAEVVVNKMNGHGIPVFRNIESNRVFVDQITHNVESLFEEEEMENNQIKIELPVNIHPALVNYSDIDFVVPGHKLVGKDWDDENVAVIGAIIETRDFIECLDCINDAYDRNIGYIHLWDGEELKSHETTSLLSLMHTSYWNYKNHTNRFGRR